MNTLWQIRLFGGLSAQREGRDVIRYQTRKTSSLLGLLAFYLHQNHSRDNVVEHIWPDLAVDNGHRCLSTVLSSLRRQLEPPDVPYGSVIRATHRNISLNPAAVTTDVREFAALVLS